MPFNNNTKTDIQIKKIHSGSSNCVLLAITELQQEPSL